eukprot:scaffold289267_cov32-Tisochrysis_lutea.AAC.1
MYVPLLPTETLPLTTLVPTWRASLSAAFVGRRNRRRSCAIDRECLHLVRRSSAVRFEGSTAGSTGSVSTLTGPRARGIQRSTLRRCLRRRAVITSLLLVSGVGTWTVLGRDDATAWRETTGEGAACHPGKCRCTSIASDPTRLDGMREDGS